MKWQIVTTGYSLGDLIFKRLATLKSTWLTFKSILIRLYLLRKNNLQTQLLPENYLIFKSPQYQCMAYSLIH